MPHNSFSVLWEIFVSPPTCWGLPKQNHLQPQPLGISLGPPHPIPKPSNNPNLNRENDPITPWLSRKWHGKVETTVKPRKNHANENKWTKWTNWYTMHSHLRVTYKILLLKLLDPTFLSYPFPSFSCFDYFSSWCCFLCETNSKFELIKYANWSSKDFFIKASISFIFLYFSSKSMSLHPPFLLFSFIFITKCQLMPLFLF